MARKKEFTDKLSAQVSKFQTELADAKAKLKCLDVEEDRTKADNLGIPETICEAEQQLTQWKADLQELQKKKVQAFPDDEATFITISSGMASKASETRGIAGVLDQIRTDRKAAEKRSRSQVDYAAKQEVRKYDRHGVGQARRGRQLPRGLAGRPRRQLAGYPPQLACLGLVPKCGQVGHHV